MKIKVDENLPAGLAVMLASLGHNADTVYQQGLAGHGDTDIWEAAQKAGRFLITQDLDFSDIRRFTPGKHHGLLLVRLRAPGRHALRERIQSLFIGENVENWEGCFLVATDHKLRVRAPGNR